jgi:hypothetical protein
MKYPVFLSSRNFSSYGFAENLKLALKIYAKRFRKSPWLSFEATNTFDWAST